MWKQPYQQQKEEERYLGKHVRNDNGPGKKKKSKRQRKSGKPGDLGKNTAFIGEKR